MQVLPSTAVLNSNDFGTTRTIPAWSLSKTCSDNRSTSPCCTIPSTGVFPGVLSAPYPLRLKPITHPTSRRYEDTLCLACIWQHALFHPGPPVRPHASLSLSLSSKLGFLHLQLFLLHLSGLFPAELYLSRGVEIVAEPSPCLCQAEWRDCPVPLVGCPSEQDPITAAGF